MGILSNLGPYLFTCILERTTTILYDFIGVAKAPRQYDTYCTWTSMVQEIYGFPKIVFFHTLVEVEGAV